MRNNRTCKKLQQKILPKSSIWFWFILIISFLLMLFGYLDDMHYLSIPLYKKFFTEQVIIRFREYLFTFSTITAAILVLYYTIQDNHREGIPHKKVVAYIFGSRTLPILLFAENMGMMLIVFIKKDTESLYAGAMLSVLIQQCCIVFIVIFSSSNFFCQHSIKYAESKQFKCLMKYRLTDRKYIWNYLIQHMSYVMAGDDMIFDKVYLIRQLLDIPVNYRMKYIDNKKADAKKIKKQKLPMQETIILKIIIAAGLKRPQY